MTSVPLDRECEVIFLFPSKASGGLSLNDEDWDKKKGEIVEV